MKKRQWLGALLAANLLGFGLGCSPRTPVSNASSPAAAVKVAYDLGSIKKGDKAHCVVCVVTEGTGAEEAVAEVIDYKGKTYAFCNEKEKADFISQPGKFTGSQPSQP